MFEVVADRPDENGRYGEFGGRFVPEILMPAILQLEEAYTEARSDPEFAKQYMDLLNKLVGRPSLLTYASRLSEEYGAKIYLKREDLNTRVLIRLIKHLARRSYVSGWVRNGLLPRQVRGSMALQRPQLVQSLV